MRILNQTHNYHYAESSSNYRRNLVSEYIELLIFLEKYTDSEVECAEIL